MRIETPRPRDLDTQGETEEFIPGHVYCAAQDVRQNEYNNPYIYMHVGSMVEGLINLSDGEEFKDAEDLLRTQWVNCNDVFKLLHEEFV